MELLNDYLLDAMAINATHIAFPDLAFPTVVQLRRFVKASKDARTNRTLAQLIDKVQPSRPFPRRSLNLLLTCSPWVWSVRRPGHGHQIEQNRRFIEKERASVDFSPKDTARVVRGWILFAVGVPWPA